MIFLVVDSSIGDLTCHRSATLRNLLDHPWPLNQLLKHALDLSFNLFPGQRCVCCARHVGFAWEEVPGCWAFAAAFGPAGSRPGGFRDTGGCPEVAADVAKSPADPARRQGPGGIGLFLPWPAEAGG